jgi:hypothetical protein
MVEGGWGRGRGERGGGEWGGGGIISRYIYNIIKF